MNSLIESPARNIETSMPLADASLTTVDRQNIELKFKKVTDPNNNALIFVVECFPSTFRGMSLLIKELEAYTKENPEKPLLIILRNVSYPRLPIDLPRTSENSDIYSSDSCYAKAFPLFAYKGVQEGTKVAISVGRNLEWLADCYQINHANNLVEATCTDPDQLLANIADWKIKPKQSA